MDVIFIKKCLPAFLIFREFKDTDKEILHAYTRFMFIIYNKNRDYRNDVVVHELYHIENFYKVWFLSSLVIFGIFLPALLMSLSIKSLIACLSVSIINGSFVDNILYAYSKKYKLNQEINAYKIQSKFFGDQKGVKKLFARFIANNYDVDVTEDYVFEKLMEGD